MAEGAAAFASSGVIVLGLVCGLVGSIGCGCGGMVLMSFSFGRYPWWNLKIPGVSWGRDDSGVLSLWLGSALLACQELGLGWLHWEMLRRWCFWLGLFTVGDFGLERSRLLACDTCGVVFAFLGGFWPGLFEGACYCHPLVYRFLPCGAFLGLCCGTRKQTTSSLR